MIGPHSLVIWKLCIGCLFSLQTKQYWYVVWEASSVCEEYHERKRVWIFFGKLKKWTVDCDLVDRRHSEWQVIGETGLACAFVMSVKSKVLLWPKLSFCVKLSNYLYFCWCVSLWVSLQQYNHDTCIHFTDIPCHWNIYLSLLQEFGTNRRDWALLHSKQFHSN